jgi:hypothetical protein
MVSASNIPAGKAPISSKCPKCHETRVVPYAVSDIAGRLRTGEAIEGMCITCSETWPLSETERADVANGLIRWMPVQLGPGQDSNPPE